VNDSGRPSGWGSPPALTPESVKGTCFCLLYDLCCWLGTIRGRVPDEAAEYRLTGLRDLTDPRQRLDRYVNPALLQSWERALEPFFASRVKLEPDLGDAGVLDSWGLDPSGRLRAEFRFANRSSVVDPDMRRHQLPPYDWVLTVLMSPEPGGFVENATIRVA
jgi:hypothetical protein